MKRIILILFVLCCTGSFSQEIGLMTYNIKYANENDGEDSWSKREKFITNQLEFYEPDIFGVQEAVQLQMEHFKNSLNGYDYIGVGREDGKKKGEYSGIFYKKDRFKILRSDTFWLSETPSEVSTGWDAALPRICTYGLFEDLETGKKFWYFNTHFDHIGTEARLQSAYLILKKIKEINTENLPVILSGDFNLEPNSEAIQTISLEMNDAKEVAQNVSFGSEGTFNGFEFEKPVTRRIDYIFTNAKVNIEKYGVLTDSKLRHYPSDHFPILTVIKLD